MNNTMEPISYRQLLGHHQLIRIPKLQRDYAQGRPGQEEVRERFLDALQEALERSPDDPKVPLNLDFIYGSIEVDEENAFCPLDGQQRLTTLFLLHWYLAWVDDCWAQFEALFVGEEHTRFSYSVRTTSIEFFDKLVKHPPGVRPDAIPSVCAWITDQPWYFSYWRLDPTIQSALTMLDAVHRRFAESRGLFARLVHETKPAITFQLLDLQNFGLSDDLYIKMNARGKPLTAFETFKARYEEDLKNTLPKESKRAIGNVHFPLAEFCARRMDTAWADFFWAHSPKGPAGYDDAVMNLFQVLALVTRAPEKDQFLEDFRILRDKDKAPTYTQYHAQKWLDEDFTYSLIPLLEQWSRAGGCIAKLLPDDLYFDEENVLKRLIRSPLELTLTEVAMFAAYVMFIREYEASLVPSEFQDWMRVARNLAINAGIERGEELRNAMRGWRELLPHARGILHYMASAGAPDRIQGFPVYQWNEELLKATLICGDAAWRPLINVAEKHVYFRGQIEFLLEFSGASAAWASKAALDAAAHARQQERFAFYLSRAQMMFPARGLAKTRDYLWERALLVQGNYLLVTSVIPNSGNNESLLLDDPTDIGSWKRLLRGGPQKSPESWKRKLIQNLWDRIADGRPATDQLEELIATALASNLEPWRKALISAPQAIQFCGRRTIRRESDTRIFLLSKVQMNGAHVELFTYGLYQRLIAAGYEEEKEPLSLGIYNVRTDRYDDPHFSIYFSAPPIRVEFMIYSENAAYVVWVQKSEAEKVPALMTGLKWTEELVNFIPWLKITSPMDKIETWLLDLATLLRTVPATAAK